jgi:hydroxymethylpyrimidine pyrophosphatase-like HAD family hydrolase
MRYRALATDYDGTIASGGIVDDATVGALRKGHHAGLRLLLVTGRQLNDLLRIFPRAELFDRVVAENGAVLYNTTNRESHVLAPGPPDELIRVLDAQAIPLSVGHSIVATEERYGDIVLSAIRDLRLAWHIVLNKGAVMALPSGVTKGTGLVAALRDIDVPPADTVGVGDAENDHALLAACGTAVAVANALPALKAFVAFVTQAEAGGGVQELLELMINGAQIDAIGRSRSL